MSKPKPSKRKSIHDKNPVDGIDNINNSVMVTRSKTLEKSQKEINGEKSDENGLSELSSDEEEIYNNVQARRRRSTSVEYRAYLRLRNQQKRNASSDSERFDSSPSPSCDPSENIEHESRKNNLKQQAKNNEKSNRSVFEIILETFNKTMDHNTLYHSLSNKNGSKNFWLIMCMIFALTLTGLYYSDYNPESDQDSNINALKSGKKDLHSITDDVKRTLKSMKAKYTNQDDNLWSDVFVGIKNIIHNPKKPSIIVLIGGKTDPLDCFAVLLGNVSRNALNSGLLTLNPENFENDMGSVITSLRSSIKDKKAVIVWDLLNINEEALKAFHNLCDRINPLVEEVIYIITIIADDYDKKIKPLEYVEKKLYEKLSGKIKEDAIQPLITRITDGPVLSVKPEPDLIDCPLPKV